MKTALHAACASGLVKVVRELLQRGANVNARDVHQQTPAHAAITSKIFEVNSMYLTRIFRKHWVDFTHSFGL